MGLSAIEGQDAARLLLAHALQGDRLGQAYLLVGPAGVGKRLTAQMLALAALCDAAPGDGCGQCETCRRIAHGVHPDVRVFAPREDGKHNLQVEYVRSEILPLTKFAPFEARRAFLIFPEADVSFPLEHPESANALLKTLEEPRANLHFVLTSERPDRLLSTIRSRCQRVRFGRLPGAAVERILAAQGIDEPTRKTAAGLAAGSVERALLLCDTERTKQVLELALRADELIASRATAELLELADVLAKSNDRALVLESLRTFYRDVAVHGLGMSEGSLAFGHERARIAERARTLAPRAAAERVHQLAALEEQLARNANAELAFDGLFFGMSLG